MGSVTALGIKDTVLDLETQLLYHLRGNFYPPIPAEMVSTCIEAIDAYYDEDYQRMVDMPVIGDFQVMYRGSTQAPASAIVEQHRLDFWVPHSMDCDCSDCIVAMEEDYGYEMGLGLE